MKRRDLLKKITEAARAQGKTFDLIRAGARHDVYRIGTETIPVPRHTEIEETTAQGILKECEPELGKGWWRNR